MSSEVAIEEIVGGVRFGVLVAPRASRETVIGTHDGALKVALTAPPVDGAANEALIAFVAKALRVARREVRITAGQRSRRKRVEVMGVRPGDVRALLGSSEAPP